MNADHELLEAALVGYRHLRDQIEEKIAEIRSQIGTAPEVELDVVPPSAPQLKRRVISAAGRRRIAAAQRKRWAERKPSESAPAPAKKRAISALGKKHIADATRKRWAEYRAQKAAAAKAAARPAKKASKRQVTKRPATASEQATT
jgi:hypothetical protein